MIDYDPHHWRSHLFDIRGSMLREITARVASCLLWAILITFLHHFVIPLSVPSTVHSLIGAALGLLLVFRTNASYDRFWEGRRMWGTINNQSRNIYRAASTMLARSPQHRDAAIRWTVIWCYSVMNSLRGKRELGPVASQMPAQDVERVLSASNVPVAVAGEITRQWIAARDANVLSDILVLELDKNVHDLINCYGACERIHRTPLPFAYVVHLRRAILLYCFTLPFALLRDYGWWTIPSTLFVAYILIGIEEIGVEIEDPFGDDENDLPLEDFCRSIERTLLTESTAKQ